METASLYGILRTIFWLILIYYAIKFLFRILAPLLFQQVVKKAEQNFHQQQQQYNQGHSQQNTQQYNTTANKPKEKKKVGEYIDYEEIE